MTPTPGFPLAGVSPSAREGETPPMCRPKGDPVCWVVGTQIADDRPDHGDPGGARQPVVLFEIWMFSGFRYFCRNGFENHLQPNAGTPADGFILWI